MLKQNDNVLLRVFFLGFLKLIPSEVNTNNFLDQSLKNGVIKVKHVKPLRENFEKEKISVQIAVCEKCFE